jgi:DNA-directed RNA polymerase subunit delta
MEKKKVVTDYSKLNDELLKLYDETYPTGIAGNTIRFPNAKGEIVTAVRLETADTIFLVKVSAKPKEVLTEEQMDELVRPSEKEESDEDEKSEEEGESSGNRSMDED